MFVFQAEHNILMHPFHMAGVAGMFGGSKWKNAGRREGKSKRKIKEKTEYRAKKEKSDVK
jgi:hypothetical protein